MQNYIKESNSQKKYKHFFVKDGERPTVRSLFDCLNAGDLLHINYDSKLHNAIKQEAFRQNECARFEHDIFFVKFRTKRLGDEIIIQRLQ